MGVAEHVEDDDVVRGRSRCAERIVEHLDELTGRAPPSHRVRQIVDLDGQGDRDEIAFRIGLQVWQVVVERIALPFVAVPDETSESVVTRGGARADPARRLRSDDLRESGGGAMHIVLVFVRRERRRHEILGISVRHDLMAGFRDGADLIGITLGQHARHIDVRRNPRSVQDRHQAANAGIRAVAAVGIGIEVEHARPQRVAHRPDRRGPLLRPCLVSDIEDDGEMAVARPSHAARCATDFGLCVAGHGRSAAVLVQG